MKKILLLIPLLFMQVFASNIDLKVGQENSLCFPALHRSDGSSFTQYAMSYTGLTADESRTNILFSTIVFNNDYNITILDGSYWGFFNNNYFEPNGLIGANSDNTINNPNNYKAYTCFYKTDFIETLDLLYTVNDYDDPDSSNNIHPIFSLVSDMDYFYYDLTNFDSSTFFTNTTLSSSPICGNNILESPPEQCDDGNTIDGDGCSSSCLLESGVCGDGIQNVEEQCDDGNTTDGDGCSSICELEQATQSTYDNLQQEFQYILNGLDYNFELFSNTNPTEPLINSDTFYSSEHLGYVLSFTDPNGVVNSVSLSAKSSCFSDKKKYEILNIDMTNEPFVNNYFGKSKSISSIGDNFFKWWNPDKKHSPDSAQENSCDYSTFLTFNFSTGQNYTISDKNYTVINIAITDNRGIFGYKLDFDLSNDSPAFIRSFIKGFSIPFTNLKIGVEPLFNWSWGTMGALFHYITENVLFFKDITYITVVDPNTTINLPSDLFGLDLSSLGSKTVNYNLNPTWYKMTELLIKTALFYHFITLIFFNSKKDD